VGWIIQNLNYLLTFALHFFLRSIEKCKIKKSDYTIVTGRIIAMSVNLEKVTDELFGKKIIRFNQSQ
jgi:hypothetical protein